MSIIGFLSLICALASAVLSVDESPWQTGTFITFGMVSVAAFAASSLRRPSLLWEVVDEIRHRRRLPIIRNQVRTTGPGRA